MSKQNDRPWWGVGVVVPVVGIIDLVAMGVCLVLFLMTVSICFGRDE